MNKSKELLNDSLSCYNRLYTECHHQPPTYIVLTSPISSSKHVTTIMPLNIVSKEVA